MAPYAVIGILSALWKRQETGEGSVVDISMLDVLTGLHTYRAKYYLVAGEIPRPVGTGHVSHVPLRAYKTKDSGIVIEAFMDHFFRNLCNALGLEKLPDDPRFNSRPKRLENKEGLDNLIEEAFQKKTAAEWCEIFDRPETEVPGGPINTLDKTLADPQLQAREMVVEIDAPHTGKLKDVGNPIKISTMGKQRYNPPPILGEHSNLILREKLGMSEEELEELKEKNII